MANEAIVSSIEKLESSLNNKYENTIHIVSETTDIRQKLETPIKLDPSKNYKVAIKYFACYNLIDNITSENNEFHYKLNGSASDWSTLRFVPGAYEIKDINEVIQEVVSDKRIEFVAHDPTGHIKLKLKPGVKVNFDHNKSFNTLLGFERKSYTNNVGLSENRPQIDLGRSLINIKSDLINSGLLTSTNNNLVTTQNILFSVPTFTVPANYKIIETPARPEYLHITTSTISEINLRIVDENDKLYDFKGEKIVIKLHITQV